MKTRGNKVLLNQLRQTESNPEQARISFVCAVMVEHTPPTYHAIHQLIGAKDMGTNQLEHQQADEREQARPGRPTLRVRQHGTLRFVAVRDTDTSGGASKREELRASLP